MTMANKTPSRHTGKTTARLARPDHERLADLFTHWAEMARAGRITGLCYVIQFDGEVDSGFGEQFWDEPHLALPGVEKLQQDLHSMIRWHARRAA